MTFFKRPYLALLAAGLLVASCQSSFDSLVEDRLAENPLPEPPTGSPGTADFTTYVSIGNSLTAGFIDGALYTQGQSYSYPALIAQQLAYAGGGEFNQPDINSVNGYNTSVQPPQGSGLVFGRFKLDVNIPGPSPVVNGELPTAYAGNKATLNNFGVPGIRIGDLRTPAAATNPLYARFASAPGSSTILGDAISRNPTFFTLWAGNNDVLGYALSGGTNTAALTSPADFQAQFTAVVNDLMTQTSAKGVVADIPLIITAPYFRAVGWNVIELDAATAGALTSAVGAFNAQILPAAAQFGVITAEELAMRTLTYAAGKNGILTVDDSLTDLGPFFDQLLGLGQLTPQLRAQLEPLRQARQLKDGLPQIGNELALLSAATILGTEAIPGNPLAVYGVSVPVPDNLTLTADEIIALETARGTNNVIIQNVVNATNAAVGSKRLGLWKTNDPSGVFYDAFGLSDFQLGVVVDGVSLAPDFGPNGIFSTDAVHPNIRGAGLLANEFIKVIETEFGASIPKVNVLNLPGVTFCGSDCLSRQ